MTTAQSTGPGGPNVLKVDLCVIGAGSAELSAASTAAQRGVRAVMIERGEMGGECLNTGCVPSKALLAAACMAHARRSAGGFGIEAAEGMTIRQQVEVTSARQDESGVTLGVVEGGQHGDDVRVLQVELSANDRAQTERAAQGSIRLVAHRNGRVLGVSILGAHAGELAHAWVLAIGACLKLKDVARMMAPYPTLGEINKAAASEFYRPKLFSALSRRVVALFSHLP